MKKITPTKKTLKKLRQLFAESGTITHGPFKMVQFEELGAVGEDFFVDDHPVDLPKTQMMMMAFLIAAKGAPMTPGMFGEALPHTSMSADNAQLVRENMHIIKRKIAKGLDGIKTPDEIKAITDSITAVNPSRRNAEPGRNRSREFSGAYCIAELQHA